MKEIYPSIQQFFSLYAARMQNALTGAQINPKEQADCFTGCFAGASPQGVICAQNDDAFLQQIEKGYSFYRSIGTQSMQLLSVEITELNELHYSVKTSWEARIRKKDQTEVVIPFVNFYFLQALNNTFKIFAFVTDDEQKAYADKGIEPYL